MNANINHQFNDYNVLVSDFGRKISSNDHSFNLLFRRSDGFTCKYGKTLKEDPPYCPWGNEIADIEITTSCRGIRDKDGNRKPCPFCYKSNNANGSYMTFETFKKIFDLINQSKTMTQIAFGVDAECKGNPDVWKIMDYCLSKQVVPNVTVADIDVETAHNIVLRCGACAVSAYKRDKNRCYDSIKVLTDEAKSQGKSNFKVNIHLLVSDETKDFCKEVIEDREHDSRLKDMNAIVLLSLKKKGRGRLFHTIDFEVRKDIIEYMLEKGIPFGMDSCGANAFLEIIKGRKDEKQLASMVENCESLLYSLYINVDGVLFPCSFMEGEGDWKEGIDLKNGQFSDFTKEVWNHPRVKEWRDQAVNSICENGCNSCPFYQI